MRGGAELLHAPEQGALLAHGTAILKALPHAREQGLFPTACAEGVLRQGHEPQLPPARLLDRAVIRWRAAHSATAWAPLLAYHRLRRRKLFSDGFAECLKRKRLF